LVLVGPTAVGKTDLSLQLAKTLDGEIISADSMQIYRYMDIGTAKPSPQERQGIPHHLIDVCHPRESFSVAQYQELATEAIADCHRRGKLPILTGGTGLYIQAVVDGFNIPSAPANPALRQELEELARREGVEKVHRMLAEVDPERAAQLHPNNLRRVIRAIEVYQATGQRMGELEKMAGQNRPAYRLYMYGLTRERAELYARINRRVDVMLEAGLIDEVRSILDMGVPADATAMQGLGYKEIVGYLLGEYSLDEAIYMLKRDTRRYAKRQGTWFRRDTRLHWFNLTSTTAATVIAQICQRLANSQ
jgi:tRNA dimethylallyltransferase